MEQVHDAYDKRCSKIVKQLQPSDTRVSSEMPTKVCLGGATCPSKTDYFSYFRSPGIGVGIIDTR